MNQPTQTNLFGEEQPVQRFDLESFWGVSFMNCWKGEKDFEILSGYVDKLELKNAKWEQKVRVHLDRSFRPINRGVTYLAEGAFVMVEKRNLAGSFDEINPDATEEDWGE